MQGIIITGVGIYEMPTYFFYHLIILYHFATGSKWCLQIASVLRFVDEMEMKMISTVMEWNELYIQLKNHPELLKYNSIHHSQVVKGEYFTAMTS